MCVNLIGRYKLSIIVSCDCVCACVCECKCMPWICDPDIFLFNLISAICFRIFNKGWWYLVIAILLIHYHTNIHHITKIHTSVLNYKTCVQIASIRSLTTVTATMNGLLWSPCYYIVWILWYEMCVCLVSVLVCLLLLEMQWLHWLYSRNKPFLSKTELVLTVTLQFVLDDKRDFMFSLTKQLGS